MASFNSTSFGTEAISAGPSNTYRGERVQEVGEVTRKPSALFCAIVGKVKGPCQRCVTNLSCTALRCFNETSSHFNRRASVLLVRMDISRKTRNWPV